MTEEKPEEKPEYKNIYEAIHGVMHRVGYVLKGGKMSAGKTQYSYAGESDLISALRPALLECGITFAVIGIENLHHQAVEKETFYDGNRTVKTEYHVTGVWHYQFTHVASETHIRAIGLGEGHDSLDKASYKAATGALKYALRQTFIIETGDDPDKVPSDPAIEEEKRQAAEKTAAKREAKAKAWVADFAEKMSLVQTQEAFVDLMAETVEHRARIAKGYPALVVSIDKCSQLAESRLKGDPKAEAVLDDTIPY